MAITKQLVYLGDFYEQAQKVKSGRGRTDLYSTSNPALDAYLGGGFGRENGYEIVVLYGEPGVGKSTVALNFLAQPIRDKVKVGLLVLEDDMADVSDRISQILTESQYLDANRSSLVRCLPDEALVRSWNLQDLLQYIEDWFIQENVQLILLDHLQFAFENSEAIKGENEYIAQRVFMQKLNQLMKKTKKTIILVSHVNKASKARGMNRIVGSGSIAQAGTKVVEITENDLRNGIDFRMWKTRFTKKPSHAWSMALEDSVLKSSL